MKERLIVVRIQNELPNEYWNSDAQQWTSSIAFATKYSHLTEIKWDEIAESKELYTVMPIFSKAD